MGNGGEFSGFEPIERHLPIPVYFNLNRQDPDIDRLNKLLWEYIPKGKLFNSSTDKEIR